MLIKGGFTNYGQEIGILMLDTIFPRIPGDIGNANSYNFPVRYKVVKGAGPDKIMGDEPDLDLLQCFIQAAQDLEREGVKAITTSCGFLAPFQKQIADAISIPVFTSALILVPLIRAMLNKGKKIAIFTERAHHLNERHFNGVGWSAKDIPVIIKGMKENTVFPSVFIGNSPELESEILRREMEEMAREIMADHPDTGAIVLECTNMGPFSANVQAIAGVPVFGINNLFELIHYAIRPPRFENI
jgi:Asp/Glu/hydantoin racemase